MEAVSAREMFEFIFAGASGYLCIATIDDINGDKKLKDQYFYWPQELPQALKFINKVQDDLNVYFSPMLFSNKSRLKQDVVETPVIWADGDDCPIEKLLLQPTVIIRTSRFKDEGGEERQRHSFLWKLKESTKPEDAESISKKVAYYHSTDGMDKCWNLGRLLRVPGTTNFKREPAYKMPVWMDTGATYRQADFEAYPPLDNSKGLPGYVDFDKIVFPESTPLELLDSYRHRMNPLAFDLFLNEPVRDWSKHLWRLEMMLFEAGMKSEEVFVVAEAAACNKYARDNRPAQILWAEVLKARTEVEKRRTEPAGTVDVHWSQRLDPKQLLTREQRTAVAADDTFVEQFTRWATSLGDAAEQYHPVSAFIVLSSLLAGRVRLPTSFGTILPNLWAMILADTTLTRKSTAMDIATDLLMEVDPDVLMATDGSIEGMLSTIAGRPGMPSLFLRDEFTGLIEQMGKKDYMAGMMESLTKLYDGRTMKRTLRSETIHVKDPTLVLYAGGIKTKMVDILSYAHVGTGFIPRFIIVTAEADLTRLKPLGPPTDTITDNKDVLIGTLNRMQKRYDPSGNGRSPGTVSLGNSWTTAQLTSAAWDIYNGFEMSMLEHALESRDVSLMTPMMDRLAKSGLKCAVLLAASRDSAIESTGAVQVNVIDVLHAFSYIEQWMKHSLYMINNLDLDAEEREVQAVEALIKSRPGITRSMLMTARKMRARQADNVFQTLEQRGQIRRERRGTPQEQLYPITVKV